MVSKEKAGELKRILEKIFHERCGLPVEVRFAYVPAQESQIRKKMEEKLNEECRQMAKERMAVQPEQQEFTEQPAKPAQEPKKKKEEEARA